MELNRWNNKKILILGGAGFIGSNLAIEFVNCGVQVKIVDGFVKYTGANMDNIECIKGKIELHNCKVEDLDNLARLVEDSDLIIDSIGLSGHNLGMENPLLDIQSNLISHLYIINSLKGLKNKRVIYLGSRGQYGRAEEPVITEDTPQNPIDVQGVSKAAAERLYEIYARRYGFAVISLRITNCFGENQKVNGQDIGLVGSFIRDILTGTTVEIYGDKERKKNLIYVRDLINIIMELSTSNFDNFEVYNLAGLEVSLRDLLENIIGIVGKGNYVIKSFPDEVRNIDVGEGIYSDKKIRNVLGELKFTDLKTSLANTINYFSDRFSEERHDLEM